MPPAVAVPVELIVTVWAEVTALVALAVTVTVVPVAASLAEFELTSRLTGVVGAALTVKVKLASVVAEQLSVARIVRVCVPAGAALLKLTTPVALLTEIVPV